MIVYNKTTMFLLVKTPLLRGDRLAMTVLGLCGTSAFSPTKFFSWHGN